MRKRVFVFAYKYWISVALFVITLIVNAFANVTFSQSLIPSVGDINQTIQKPVEPPSGVIPGADKLKEQNVDITPVSPAIVLPDIEGKDIHFIVQKIVFEGNTAFSDADLERQAIGLFNTEISFYELAQLAQRLTQYYREHGFVTSEVVIPPQTMKNGIVLLQVYEGRIGTVRLIEGRYFKARSIQYRLSEGTNDLFNLPSLKTSLRNVNDNTDLSVSAELKPGSTPHTSDIDLVVKDKLPFHVTPSWDNLGREVIGTHRFGLLATHNNLFGFGDQEQHNLSWTRRSFGLVNQYKFPLGSHGTFLGFDYGFSTLRLGGDLKAYDISGRSITFSPHISQMLLNKPTVQISADLGFDIKNLTTDISQRLLYDDRLRLLRPGLNLNWWDKYGRTMSRQELGIGIPVFEHTMGNSSLASRAGAGSQFFRYTGSITRIQKLPLNSMGVLRANYQISTDRLVSSEQIQMGGAYTVRGYREGSLIGDSGLIVNAEWYYPLRCFPKQWKVPFSHQPFNQAFQGVIFSDIGINWVKRTTHNQYVSKNLLGVGVGLRAQLTSRLVGRLDLGIPLLIHQPDNLSPRLHFGVQAPLF